MSCSDYCNWTELAGWEQPQLDQLAVAVRKRLPELQSVVAAKSAFTDDQELCHSRLLQVIVLFHKYLPQVQLTFSCLSLHLRCRGVVAALFHCAAC